MERAVELAKRALGWCSPNPAVGAVLVRDGQIVGEGWTQPAGQDHAEVVALRQAGPAAAGATLYVTLEPCNHVGRTPPCTDAIIAAGVREVRIATHDPSPWVNRGGIEVLEAAGVHTAVGERERDAVLLNEAYFAWVRSGTPFLTLKYAMTADGKIATRTGSSFWITGPEARRHVAQLRATVDAVMVGIGTVLADDPRLTARPGDRDDEHLDDVHQPLRVVLDSAARLSPAATLVSGGLPGPTLVLTTERASASRVRELVDRAVEVVVLAARDGRVDICEVLRFLGNRGVTSVLAEGGGTLAASLLAAGGVDKVLAFVAPKLVGGSDAPTPVGGTGLSDTMDRAIELRDPTWTVLGRDVLLTGYVRDAEPRTLMRQSIPKPESQRPGP
ncbi:MAG: bifunctional diaminohydroxyphosphoribosylaminopyrimidine deaminase/5-amino-6-(5-phosphoribosylamino)uracil reductase RibD [Chloroflexi bacterium]|nr:bifunctional diaminohydroxyphosphoribosylaminopyrimidine deaminase/5-amino-6-(5-phosphoribosylamino)uracil reductase RibD [Chloroflexota bacterium]